MAEGNLCTIVCKYLFVPENSTDGEPNRFEARSEGPKILRGSHFIYLERKYIFEK